MLMLVFHCNVFISVQVLHKLYIIIHRIFCSDDKWMGAIFSIYTLFFSCLNVLCSFDALAPISHKWHGKYVCWSGKANRDVEWQLKSINKPLREHTSLCLLLPLLSLLVLLCSSITLVAEYLPKWIQACLENCQDTIILYYCIWLLVVFLNAK